MLLLLLLNGVLISSALLFFLLSDVSVVLDTAPLPLIAPIVFLPLHVVTPIVLFPLHVIVSPTCVKPSPHVVTIHMLLGLVPFLACDHLLYVSLTSSDGDILLQLSHHFHVNVQPVTH
ncbi:uncharacterized protein UDID_19451 [Ustilago sp. UG-2017a]|nr:uncharacterized protein UDID_19451 [Ustilago sp. UG-2017a]